MTYEEAINELQNIADALESGKLTLDESVKLFEKSVKLSKTCFEKIKQTDGQVLLIKKELDEIKLNPFTDINKSGDN